MKSEKLIQDGANIIDIGGESTRPGALKVSEKEELEQRRQFVINEKPSKEYIDKIDSLSADYENQYFKDIPHDYLNF